MTEQQSEANEPKPVPPVAPASAALVFGERLPLAEQFVEILADTGLSHGLIGPREIPRLWDRHVLNCAVIEGAFPSGVRVVDVGSGAGLPGLALAIARPDLRLLLVEPMLRRTNWLSATTETLGLDNVEVHRGRAEEFVGKIAVSYATARAVARIDKLARWCLPLLEPGGTLVAMKGSSAAEELEAERPSLTKLGAIDLSVTKHGESVLEEPVLTVDVRLGPDGMKGSTLGGKMAKKKSPSHKRQKRT